MEEQEECVELKNIKYKTMLLVGNPLVETKTSSDLSNIDKFLEQEKNTNKNGPWCKLDKTVKLKKLIEYSEVYSQENELLDDEIISLQIFFQNCLNRKKLMRVKDVVYDKTEGKIKRINGLIYVKSARRFSLKTTENGQTRKSLSYNPEIKNL